VPAGGDELAHGRGVDAFDDEPMCTFTTVPTSSQVAKNLSQWPEWMLG